MRVFRIFVVLLALTGALATQQASADVVLFSDDFEDETPVPGGPYAPPDGWTAFNVDGRTPDPQVGYVTSAWIVREDFKFDINDQVAFSTSFYSPVGQADDWMWTPEFTLAEGATLSWDAVAYDPNFPDGYEVRILPGGGAPTADPAASTVLATIAGENSDWTSRSIDLDALGYTSGPARIAFRNNTNDRFVVLVDDVLVVADTTAPAAPVLSTMEPASPSSDTTPVVKGTAEALSTVTLYGTSDCTGVSIGSGTAEELASTGITATLPANQTTSVHATATDAGTNVSPCSAGLSYTVDTIAPSTTIAGPAVVKTRTRRARVTVTLASPEAGVTFECSIDGGAFAPCGPSFSTKLPVGRHTITAHAIDAASNIGPDADHDVRVKRRRAQAPPSPPRPPSDDEGSSVSSGKR